MLGGTKGGRGGQNASTKRYRDMRRKYGDMKDANHFNHVMAEE